MRIYFAETDMAPAGRWLLPGRGRGEAGAAAWSLLLWALRRDCGLLSLPETGLDARGKPFFPGEPGLCFSLSHTRGAVLCALSSSPVGADVQRVRERDLAFAARLMDEREREGFTFHELWCLRESVYKLTGEGSLRSLRFRREGGLIVPPAEGVVCRLYDGIPGCAAAAAARGAELPERAERVDVGELLR